MQIFAIVISLATLFPDAELVEIAKSGPNVHVVDWHAYVAQHPGLLHSDKTHPNMKGIVAFADLLRDALEELDA